MDRAAAAEVAKHSPHMPAAARANRSFMVRAIRYLAQEHGFRQFLDIGTGLPTSPNLHEVDQQVAAESRIVYVDNDPIVLVHARALLTSSPEGHRCTQWPCCVQGEWHGDQATYQGASGTLLRRPEHDLAWYHDDSPSNARVRNRPGEQTDLPAPVRQRRIAPVRVRGRRRSSAGV